MTASRTGSTGGRCDMAPKRKPRLSVWKFASCDGCQLSLLDCEDELLTLAGAVNIAYFVGGHPGHGKGPYDLSLVDGSITTAHDAERDPAGAPGFQVPGGHRRLRHCRGHPGPAQFHRRQRLSSTRSTPSRSISRPWRSPRPSRPMSRWILSLSGCPINKHQLLEVIKRLSPGAATHGPVPQRLHRLQDAGATSV